jgi:nucleotide-binding universal stress UspA family protein
MYLAPPTLQEEAMTIQAVVPIATYPESIRPQHFGSIAALAKGLGCDLHALVLLAKFPKVANALSSLLLDVPDMIRSAEARSRKSGDELLHALQVAVTSTGGNLTSSQAFPGPDVAGEIAAEHARYFDLAMVGVSPDNDVSRNMAEAVVFGAGRPVLLVPETLRSGDPRHAVIAWDGSRVAARAVADAALLLGQMRRVTVLCVLNEKPLPDDDIGDRLAAALKRRGVAADARSIELEDQPIGHSLQGFATDDGAGLLVMGAYGHSRLRDFVLGGATRAIIDDLRMPVLMSH